MARTKSSHQWMQRHVNDEYVKRSKKDGYRSRAAYKLEEIQEKDRIIKQGQVVVDLGCAPGGWCQIAAPLVGKHGRVVGIDLLDMPAVPGVDFLQGDFREDSFLAEMMKMLDGRQVDLVISDMAPNISGQTVVDQPRGIYLCELALDFCRQVLAPNGGFVTKIFQGEGFDDFFRDTRSSFGRVVTRKPKASRPKSREVYIVASQFKG